MALLSFDEVARVAFGAGFRGESLVIAVAVSKAESGHNTTIVSRTGDYGLWQINKAAHGRSYDWGRITVPAYNAQAAFKISGSGTNWRPWSVFKSGKYKAHMGAARAAVGSLGNGGGGGAPPSIAGPAAGPRKDVGPGGWVQLPGGAWAPPLGASQPEAMGSVAIDALLLNGGPVPAEVGQVLTSANVERTIDGAPTLSVTLHDSQRSLVRSGLFSSRLTCQVDRYAYELVKVNKTGDGLVLTFEELAVAAMRRHTNPRKVGPGYLSRVEFATMLIRDEEPWIAVRYPPLAVLRTKVELAKGNPDQGGGAAEDTWAALGRIFEEVGWRRFVVENVLYLAPDEWLLAQPPLGILSENTGYVDEIDFDWDAGKPVATATVTCEAHRWQFPPGGVIGLVGCGPADGGWLISNISRSLFSTKATVTLIRPRPQLPEPEPPSEPESERPDSQEGTGQGGQEVSGGGSRGYAWPMRGRVSSGFGQRGGRLHAGLDIAGPTGTPIGATKAGTVTYAGSMSGYGNVVIVRHPDNVFTRYAHMSQITCSRGQQVGQGQELGKCGSTGNSTGPHVHFEVRPGDRPVDPKKFLS